MVTFDAVGPSSSGQTGTTTLASWTHTVGAGATQNVVIVGLAMDGADPGISSSATYAGSAMTSLGVVHADGGTNGYVQLWWAKNVPTGGSTVAITVSGGTPQDLIGASISYSGAIGVGTPVTNNAGPSASMPVTVNNTTAGNVISGWCAAGAAITQPGSPASGRFINNFQGSGGDFEGNFAEADAPAGGSVTMTWTTPGSNSWAIMAVEVQGPPTAASPAPAVPPGMQSPMAFPYVIQPMQPPPAAVAGAPAAVPSVPPRQPPRTAAHRAKLGRLGAAAAGILAVTTLSPQPSSVPPARPAPVIAHPAPHRAIVKGILVPPQQAFLTAKLPPTAVSPRPPHRAIAKGILAKTTLSPQPSSVPPPQWRQPNAPRPAHRAIWRGIAGPAPSVVAAAAAISRPAPVTNRPPVPHRAIVRGILVPPTLPGPPSRPLPTVNRPPAPHRALAKGILAPNPNAPQPSRVPPPQWRQPNAPRPAHRAIWRGIAGPAPSVVAVTSVPPSRPAPTTNRPPAPHRALAKGILAPNPNAPQPSRVPPPQWRQPFAPRPPHRGIWRGIAGPAPAPAPARPSRPAPVTNRPPAPHRAIAKGILAKTTLSAQPARVNGPQWRQPFAPRPAHRAIWRGIAGAAPPPPPFTVGVLTAADTSLAALTAATAAGGSGGVLTATDARTGGPG